MMPQGLEPFKLYNPVTGPPLLSLQAPFPSQHLELAMRYKPPASQKLVALSKGHHILAKACCKVGCIRVCSL